MIKILRFVLIFILAALTVLSVMVFSDLFIRKEPVAVTVTDNGTAYYAAANENMTVEEIIGSLNLTVAQKDSVTPSLETVWKDSEEDGVTILRYARVRLTDGEEEKTVELYGGKVGDAMEKAGFDIQLYHPNIKKNSYLKDGMVIEVMKIKNGFLTDDYGTYYYLNGEMQYDCIVGSEEEGFYYADDYGVIDYGYCDGITIDGEDWIIINGKAQKVETEKDKTLYRAAEDIGRCTYSYMSKEEKMEAAFRYLQNNYLEGVPHDPPYTEDDWEIVCANDIFVNGKGDCYSYGAAYAFMCKAVGCSEVYACNSGGHGWTEAEGLVYDPEWSMHSDKYSYYAISPGDPVDVNYWTSINDESWQKKAI